MGTPKCSTNKKLGRGFRPFIVNRRTQYGYEFT